MNELSENVKQKLAAMKTEQPQSEYVKVRLEKIKRKYLDKGK